MSYVLMTKKMINRLTLPTCWQVMTAGLSLLSLLALNPYQAQALPKKIPTEIRDVLIDYCYDCHGEGMRKGKVDFDVDDAKLLANKKLWAKTWENLITETMPPPKKDQPELGEKRRLIDFIDQKIFGRVPGKPDPGRVTIRRLNQREYQNTIQDLLGIKYETAENFLPDDTGYGFDNIGDVLSLSPGQMDKYFGAAEKIVADVLDHARLRTPEEWVHDWKMQKENNWQIRRGKLWIPHDGEYQFKVEIRMGNFYQYQGHVPVRMKLDDKVILEAEWKHDGKKDKSNRSLKGFDKRMHFKKGEHWFELHYDLESGRQKKKGKDGKDKKEDKIRFSLERARAFGPYKPLIQKRDGNYKKIFFEGLEKYDDPKKHKVTRKAQLLYARKILKRIADRAYRRPADKAAMDRIMRLVVAQMGTGYKPATSQQFVKAVGEGLFGILVSPRFLYRAEYQPRPDDPASIHKLDEHALASRLSYFLWSSLPDEKLKSLADKGELRKNLKAELARMMKDGKFRRFTKTFVGQWLHVDNVQGQRFGRAYEETVRVLRRDMRAETEEFFNYIIDKKRPMIEILNANYSFLNEKLAKHYGIPGVQGSKMRKVDFPEGTPRAGILTQGSYLVVTSDPTKTSPVKRGVFVLENILASPPPPAPADVPSLEEITEKSDKVLTLRETLELHRDSPLCASCHARMDPIGFGLENFDPIGRWREAYPVKKGKRHHGPNGKEVMAKDKLIESAGSLDTGGKFNSPTELIQLLSQRKRHFYRCITQKLMTYALGRGVTVYDYPTIEKIVDRIMKKEDFAELLQAVVESPQFQLRRGHGPKDEITAVSSH